MLASPPAGASCLSLILLSQTFQELKPFSVVEFPTEPVTGLSSHVLEVSLSLLAPSGQKGEVSGRGQPWQEVFHGEGDMQQVVGIAKYS